MKDSKILLYIYGDKIFVKEDVAKEEADVEHKLLRVLEGDTAYF